MNILEEGEYIGWLSPIINEDKIMNDKTIQCLSECHFICIK